MECWAIGLNSVYFTYLRKNWLNASQIAVLIQIATASEIVNPQTRHGSPSRAQTAEQCQ